MQPPSFLIGSDIALDALEMTLPDWPSPRGLVQAVIPSRRGLLPAVRGFIDFSAVEFQTIRSF